MWERLKISCSELPRPAVRCTFTATHVNRLPRVFHAPPPIELFDRGLGMFDVMDPRTGRFPSLSLKRNECPTGALGNL